MILSEKEALMAEPSENSRQFIHNAIEMALSFGDFQKEIDSDCSPRDILQEAAFRIEHLVPFDTKAFFLVEETSSDFLPEIVVPSDDLSVVEPEFAQLIQNGYLAWAIRERRGITVYTQDGSRRILLHVLATYSRVRGLFIGFFPKDMKRLPTASLEVISLILRSTANGLESLTYQSLFQQQNDALEKKVVEKTARLLRFERQLMQAQKTEAIVALAGGIAHQFNNVLTGLVGNLDLLEMNNNNDTNVSQFIQQARSVSDRMSKLTRQLLTYVQSGKFNPTQISIDDLINGAFPVLRRLVQPSVHLISEQADEDIMVNVDVTQMQMVISAIVTNADEAISEDGEIRISTAKVPTHNVLKNDGENWDAGCCVRISIEDTGKGMDEEAQRRLFEPFYTTKFEGRGLGMAMSLGIIKSHLGNIRVSSEVDCGTRVDIFLPCNCQN